MKIFIDFVNDANISKMRSGNGLLIGDLDETHKFAVVTHVGVIEDVDLSASKLKVQLRRKSLILRPHPSGAVHWKKKRSFKFDLKVSARYLFESIFAEEFEYSTWNKDFISSAMGGQSPSRNQTINPETDYFPSQASQSDTLFRAQSDLVEPEWLVKKRTLFSKSGFVYLLKINDYFKFQGSKFLPSESPFFILNRDQEIEIIHTAWFTDYRFAENELQSRFYENRFDGELLYLDANEIRKIKGIGENVAVVREASAMRGRLQ